MHYNCLVWIEKLMDMAVSALGFGIMSVDVRMTFYAFILKTVYLFMSWAINDVVLREDGFSIYAEQKVDVSEVSLILQGIFLL